MFFYPTFYTGKVTDISLQILNYLNIKSVILDVDDTLVAHKTSDPNAEIVEWINMLKFNKLKIILLSNNFKNRVQSFADKLNIPYISLSMKPLTFGLKKAINKLNTTPSEILMIGDQIFTDVLAANISGIKSVLVDPIKESNSMMFKIKRCFENRIKRVLKSNPKFSLKSISEDKSS